MPSQSFRHSATADASIETVWATLDRPETWESISGIDSVFDATVDHDGRLRGFSFDTEISGKSYAGQAAPLRRTEGKEIAWSVRNSEVKGSLEVQLAPADGGTQITVGLTVQSASFLAGVLFPAIAGAIGNGLPQAVEDFAGSFSRKVT